MESMAHFENHTLAQCGLKCLQAIFCQAFTYEENDRPNCSLHAKLLEIEHYQPVIKPRAKYFQRVSFKSYIITFLFLYAHTCYIIDIHLSVS